MKEMFGSSILHRHFHGSLAVIIDENSTSFSFKGLNILPLQNIEEISFEVNSDLRMLEP